MFPDSKVRFHSTDSSYTTLNVSFQESSRVYGFIDTWLSFHLMIVLPVEANLIINLIHVAFPGGQLHLEVKKKVQGSVFSFEGIGF